MAYNNTFGQFAVFTSPATPISGSSTDASQTVGQVFNVDNVDFDWDGSDEPITVLGNSDPIGRARLDPYEVNASVSYYYDLINGDALFGLSASNNLWPYFRYVLGDNSKNIYILQSRQGTSVNSQTAADIKAIGIGNAYISNYTFEASVGDYPRTTVDLQGLNLRGYPNLTNQIIPAIDPETGLGFSGVNYQFSIPTPSGNNFTGIIKPGDVVVNLRSDSTLSQNTTGICPQSVNWSVDFNREVVQCLGSKRGKGMSISPPVEMTLSLEINSNDIKTFNLADFYCSKAPTSVDVVIYNPSCVGTGSRKLTFRFSGFTLNGESYSTSVDNPQTVTMTWTGPLGSQGEAAGLSWTGLTPPGGYPGFYATTRSDGFGSL